MNQKIIRKFKDPSYGLLGASALYKKLHEDGFNVSLADVKEALAGEEAYTLNTKRINRFSKRQTIAHGIDDLFQADLIDMSQYADINKDFHFILTVIDVFSKYAWAIPLLNKNASGVASALTSIFAKRSPKYLQTDKGTEFYNKTVEKVLKKYKIHHYSTQNEIKGAVIERFNRTLKMRLTKLYDVRQTFKYYDVLPKIMDNYNNSFHRTIKMTPKEASKQENEQEIFNNVYPNQININPPKNKFNVGDYVRITIKKSPFSKEGTGNYTIEVFKIVKIQNTNPITYKIVDLKDEDITGTFYEEELVKVPKSIIDKPFRINEVLEVKGTGNNKEAFVSFLGYPQKFNKWVPFAQVKNIVKK